MYAERRNGKSGGKKKRGKRPSFSQLGADRPCGTRGKRDLSPLDGTGVAQKGTMKKNIGANQKPKEETKHENK